MALFSRELDRRVRSSNTSLQRVRSLRGFARTSR